MTEACRCSLELASACQRSLFGGGGGLANLLCFSKVWFLSLPLLAGGFALVTHQAAKLYFILFHIVVVILIVK